MCLDHRTAFFPFSRNRFGGAVQDWGGCQVREMVHRRNVMLTVQVVSIGIVGAPRPRVILALVSGVAAHFGEHCLKTPSRGRSCRPFSLPQYSRKPTDCLHCCCRRPAWTMCADTLSNPSFFRQKEPG